MSDLTNYGEQVMRSVLLGKSSPATTTRDLALFSAVTDAEAGTITELTGNGYARQDIKAAFGTPSGGGAQTNTSAITFPTAVTSDWATATHYGVHDGTDWTTIKALDASRTVQVGDTLEFAIGALSFEMQ